MRILDKVRQYFERRKILNRLADIAIENKKGPTDDFLGFPMKAMDKIDPMAESVNELVAEMDKQESATPLQNVFNERAAKLDIIKKKAGVV